jgi:hypothetical protein
MEAEVRLLRQQFLDERTRREQMIIEQQQMVTKLQEQMVTHEHDLLRRLKDSRDDQMQLILGN